jgi:predicted metal-dependent hydrolase
MSLFSVRRQPAHADGDRLQIAGVDVRLSVNPRARRVSLRLDRTRAEIVAVAPSLRRLPDAVAFAHERAQWMAQQIDALPAQTTLAPGRTLELFGRPAVLGVTPGRARRLVDPTGGPDRLLAPTREGDGGEAWRGAVLRLLKREALAGLTTRTAAYAAALGQPMPRVGIGDTRSRWGSCRQARRGYPAVIRYSWRVMLAPPAIADYLCAHECAHLVRGDHSPEFWAVVRSLNGDHRPHRAWLRAHGAELHGVG